MKSAAATWSRDLYRPIRAFWSWDAYLSILLMNVRMYECLYV